MARSAPSAAFDPAAAHHDCGQHRHHRRRLRGTHRRPAPAQAGRNARITLIAPKAELHYLPGIIWIPSGLRKREDLIVPLGNFFRRMNVTFHQPMRPASKMAAVSLRPMRARWPTTGLSLPRAGASSRSSPASSTRSRLARASPPRENPRPARRHDGRHDRRWLRREPQRANRDARRTDVRIPVRHRPPAAPRRPPRPLQAHFLQPGRKARQPPRPARRRRPAQGNEKARHRNPSRPQAEELQRSKVTPRAASSTRT